MKHYIIVKFKEGTDKAALLEPVTKLFEEALEIPGVHGVKVKPCCIDRANRYDFMIVIDMDKEALSGWDASRPHHLWKDNYGDLFAAKAIFDSED